MSDSKKEISRVMTPAFRVSFPNVFKPKAAYENSEPTYNLQMLFPKDPESHEYPDNVKQFAGDLKKLKALAKKAKTEKFGDKKMGAGFRSPFRDGDEKVYDGYKGMTFVNAKSKQKPGIVDRSNEEIIDPNEFYAGCWARATLVAFAYDTAGNKGVAFGLQNIQFLGDGEAFSGKKNAKDDFEMIDSDFGSDVDTSEEDDDDDF